LRSKALEVNLACTRVDVTVSERYDPLREIMAGYHGLMEKLDGFLREVCHPYRNWAFIVKEARKLALDTFHLLRSRSREKGPEAAGLYVDIWLEAAMETTNPEVKKDAADNLLLYLRKVVTEAGDALPDFLAPLYEAYERIACLEEDAFRVFVRSYYEIGRLAADFLEKNSRQTGFLSLNRLLVRNLRVAYGEWLAEEDPLTWFRSQVGLQQEVSGELEEVFRAVSHEEIHGFLEELEALEEEDPDSRELSLGLNRLPGYRDFIKAYEGIPRKLERIGQSAREGERWKLIFLFHMMDIEGLSNLHEEILRKIHRTLSGLLEKADRAEAEAVLRSAFSVLQRSMRTYPSTALNSVLNIGRAVFATGRRRLISLFSESAADLDFQGPDLGGEGDPYLSTDNAAHVQNIRTWMELIGMEPAAARKLLSCLTIHLALRGVFIRDVDFFPREVTRLLNTEIGPVYNQVKQLARLLPTYFNEIGAEGRLRDVSTQMDEILNRQDVLVHFLRKQSHVESSNRIVGLVEGALSYWWTGRRESLKTFVPADLYARLDQGEGFPEGIHRILERLASEGRIERVEDLLDLAPEEVQRAAKGLGSVSGTDPERLDLAIEFYQLLYQKYRLGTAMLERYLDQVPYGTFPDLDALRRTLREKNSRKKLQGLLDYLEMLGNTILSDKAFEVREDIYHKRHIAADIPSVYGSYHEPKFDAMGLTLRLEPLLNSLLEDLVASVDLSLVTWATMFRTHQDLELIARALRLDGISSTALDIHLDLLERALAVRGFSFGQFVDVFRGLEDAVRTIVHDDFTNIHQSNLTMIVERIGPDALLPKYRPPAKVPASEGTLAGRASEIFLRERIASTPGLQPLDLLVGRVTETLSREAQKLPEDSLRALLDFDPERAVSPLHPVRPGMADLIYLGNKALNLVRLQEYGFPVPPGFVVSTEVFRCRRVLHEYPPAAEHLRNRIEAEIVRLEKATGTSFGDPRKPLLLSVRSGAAISQPGMMETILNVGVNEDVVRGMAEQSGNAWFAWDCYRRFLQSYGMAFGINRDVFDDLIRDHKERSGVTRKAELRPEQMAILAKAYRDLVEGMGVRVEDEPLEQLQVAVDRVFDSWSGARAASYRRILGISDEWGTAVTVQKMVYGNASSRSGAGVAFTHSPRWPSEEIQPWGDYTPGNQGEDMVSGLVNTFPLTRKQAELEMREEQPSLEEAFPEVFAVLIQWIEELVVQRGWGPQDMEFTFEGPGAEDLYILQSRNMDMRRADNVPRFEAAEEVRERMIGRGVGAGGGALAGRAVYNLSEIHHWRGEEPDTALILIRGDTVPDDIEEIHAADGLLTARGGATSHAAIVANRLGKTCVVGLSDLLCDEKGSACSMGGARFLAGDWLSIDGQAGSVYAGQMKIIKKDLKRR